MISRIFKLRWSLDDSPTEWTHPSLMPLDMIHLEGVNDNALQIFVGQRVICTINTNLFMSDFRIGKGYEYIEKWKVQTHTLDKLSGAQILRITELLRQYGHEHNA